jgi:putative flippase GtrA
MKTWFGRREEFARFILCGGVNTVLTYTIYVVCLLFMPYRLAYTFTFACGIMSSYFLNARFVFRQKLKWSKALQYPVAYLLQYFVGLALLYCLVELAHVSKFFAPFLVLLATIPLTFVMNRRVLKGSKKRR